MLGAHHERLRAHGRPLLPVARRRYTSCCCNIAVVITPAGREPGTSRAERGRSLQPVASSTAAGANCSRPRCRVSSSGPPGDPAGDHRLGAELGAGAEEGSVGLRA